MKLTDGLKTLNKRPSRNCTFLELDASSTISKYPNIGEVAFPEEPKEDNFYNCKGVYNS